MATPLVFAQVSIEKLDEFLLELREHDKIIEAGVASVGPASAYAMVWEWGNVRQSKPGPKTVLGTNPDGEMVWLSIQAPFGYIKIHENDYWQIIKEELGKVQFKGVTAKEITAEMEAAATKAMRKIVQIVQDSVPVDKGDLKDSIQVVLPGDTLLDDSDDDKLLSL